MTDVERLARFVVARSWDDLSDPAREGAEDPVLDALGCALGALDAAPVRAVRGVSRRVRRPAPVHADRRRPQRPRPGSALQRRTRPLSRLQRLLLRPRRDLPSERQPLPRCSPPPNTRTPPEGSCWSRSRSPIRCSAGSRTRRPCVRSGFDHTTQGAYAVAAGVAKALRLDATQTANAIAIAGTALNALRVTRTGALSHWKGLAYPFTAFGAVDAVFLAARGISGPAEVFEGNKGFMRLDRRPVRDRLGARGPRARPAHLPQALQRRDPLPIRARGAARAA